MGFNFKKFTDVDSSFAARISIRQNGQFGFNSGAINKFRVDDFNYCFLYFDSEFRAVGIELSRNEEGGCLQIQKQKKNTYIRAKNFLDKYEIDYGSSSRYELRRDEATNFLYFLLEDREEEEEPPSEMTASGSPSDVDQNDI